MRALRLLIVMSLGLAAHSAIAQPAPRTIAADSGSGWTHRLSKLTLPATVAGLTAKRHSGSVDARNSIVAATYARSGRGTCSLFDLCLSAGHSGRRDLVRPRRLGRSGHRRSMGWKPQSCRPRSAFATPGAGARRPSACRSTCPATELEKHRRWRSRRSGPGWSRCGWARVSLDKAALDAKLDCAAGRARLARRGRNGARRGGDPALSHPAQDQAGEDRARRHGRRADQRRFLLDRAAKGRRRSIAGSRDLPPEFGVYRANGDEDSYVVALNDAGLALSVGPSLGGLLGGSSGKTYSLSRLDHGSAAILPSFNRLPPPAQAVSVAQGSAPMISATPPR